MSAHPDVCDYSLEDGCGEWRPVAVRGWRTASLRLHCVRTKDCISVMGGQH